MAARLQSLDPDLAECGFFPAADHAGHRSDGDLHESDEGAVSDSGGGGDDDDIATRPPSAIPEGSSDVVDFPCKLCDRMILVGHTPKHRETADCLHCEASVQKKGAERAVGMAHTFLGVPPETRARDKQGTTRNTSVRRAAIGARRCVRRSRPLFTTRVTPSPAPPPPSRRISSIATTRPNRRMA